MTTIASFGVLTSTGLQWLAALFADRGSELHQIDARTLADIGIDASEISSIEAEWLGHAEITRRRIAAW
jgi:hypothetical protein